MLLGLQVLQAIAWAMPAMTETAYAATLQILLCLSLDIRAADLAGLLEMTTDASLPLHKTRLLSVTQLVWSRTGNSLCSVLAIKVDLIFATRPCMQAMPEGVG